MHVARVCCGLRDDFIFSIGVNVMEKRELTEKEYFLIENSLVERGYLKQEYVMPRRTETTSVKCPWCSKLLMI